MRRIPSVKRKTFPLHDVCQGQDSCGIQGARLVKSGTGSLLRETPLQQTRAQSLSHPFFRSVPWSLFCVSHYLFCSVLECLNGFRCVTGCHSFHRIFGSTFYPKADPGKPRAVQHGDLVISRKTHNFFGLSLSLFYLARHEFFGGVSQSALIRKTQIRWLVSCPLRVNFNAVVVQQRRAATRLFCNCQGTGIFTPQWPPCTCDLQSTFIACVSDVFCVWHSTRTQFLHASAITDHRIHSFEAHPSKRSTGAAALQASLAARLHGKLCETSCKTHLLDLFVFISADRANQIRVACAKPQTSREVDQDHEGVLTMQRNARPSFLITCSV